MKNKKAVIRNGKIVYDVDATPIIPNDTEARANRQSMKVNKRKELLQRNDLNYYRAYPEQAKNLSDEIRRLI